jgi:hypothetical protein
MMLVLYRYTSELKLGSWQLKSKFKRQCFLGAFRCVSVGTKFHKRLDKISRRGAEARRGVKGENAPN